MFIVEISTGNLVRAIAIDHGITSGDQILLYGTLLKTDAESFITYGFIKKFDQQNNFPTVNSYTD
jgi:hypothetical protein